MRNARRWRVAGLVAACSVAIAACSSEPESSTPTVELSTTTVTTLPPTTETTEAPTTTIDPRIAEVEAAVAEARAVQVQLFKSADEPVEILQQVLTGRALASVTDAVLLVRADGLEVRGEFVGTPVSTVISGGSAVHIQCGLDSVGSFDGDEVVVAADDASYLLRYELEADEQDQWRVELVRFEGDSRVPCDL